MAKNKVSILLVSYNAEKYIKKTVESCLNQTYKNVEILLLDNNSQDKTVEIIKKMEQQSSQLKIFQSEKNLGPYGGLNFLLEKARGEYIAIQDHDDIWFPEKIEKQVKFLEKNNNFIACGTNTFYFFEDRKVLILKEKSKITNFVDHTSLMFRNKNFRYNKRYLLADEYFEKIILAKKGKIGCIQKGLTVHRIKKNGTNLSNSRFKISIKNVKDFFEINGLNKNSLSYLTYLFLSKFLSNNIMWFIRKNITQKNNKWINLDIFISKYFTINL